MDEQDEDFAVGSRVDLPNGVVYFADGEEGDILTMIDERGEVTRDFREADLITASRADGGYAVIQIGTFKTDFEVKH